MKKLNRWGKRGIAAIGLIIFGGLTAFSWIYTVERPTWGFYAQIQRDSVLGNLLAAFAAVVFFYLVWKLMDVFQMEHVRGVTVGASVLVCGLLFWAIPAVRAIPQADQAQVYWGTRWLLEGEFDAVREYSYFVIYPFQLSFCKLQACLFRIFGADIVESYQFMQYVNAVCVSATFYMNACVARELFADAKAEIICLLCELMFLPMFLYTFFHYGDPIGVCFAVAAVYFFLLAVREKQKGVWRALCGSLCAASLFIICLARSVLLIAAVATIIMALLLYLRQKKLLPFLLAAGCLLAALAGYRLWDGVIERQTGVQFEQGAARILWVVMGLQGGMEIEDNPGSYNGYNWVTYFDQNGDPALTRATAKSDLRKRLAEWAEQPSSMIRFFKSKILNQWIEPSFKGFSATNLMEEPPAWIEDFWYRESFQKAYRFLDRYQSVCYLFMAGFFLLLLAEKRTEWEYLPALIAIGGFLFSLIWESSGRYTYPYMVLGLPCVTGGLIYLEQQIDRGVTGVAKRLRRSKEESEEDTPMDIPA